MKIELKTYFENLIKEMFNINENVEITNPSNIEFGDFTSNIALENPDMSDPVGSLLLCDVQYSQSAFHSHLPTERQ